MSDTTEYLALAFEAIANELRNHASIDAQRQSQRLRLDRIKAAADIADRLTLKSEINLKEASEAAALAFDLPPETIRMEITRRDQTGKSARLALAHKKIRDGHSIRSTARRLNIPKSTLHDRLLTQEQKRNTNRAKTD